MKPLLAISSNKQGISSNKLNAHYNALLVLKVDL